MVAEPGKPEGRSTTRELLRAAERGEQEAWHALYLRYRKLLRGMIQRRLPPGSRGRGDSEDVLQSTFVAAWKALDDFEYRGPDSFRRWLGTILDHEVIDLARGEERRRRGLEELRREVAPALQESPSTVLVRDELQRRLLEALTSLSLEDQELIGQHFFDRLSWAEIAGRHGVVESTVRRRMLDALERLMRRID
jgi:RNA polymerase sigma-70 factor (ECF subfamily)